MKKLIFVLLLFLTIGFLTAMLYINSGQENQWNDSTPLSDFVIGKWKGQITINNGTQTYIAKYWLKFINKNKLKFCGEYANNYSCSEHSYFQIRDDIFRLENERANNEWKITRDGKNLIVCTSTKPIDKDSCIPFTRDDSWW